MNNTIKRTVIDEGTVAYFVMSLACWKGSGSPTFSKSRTMLTTFNGRYFRPHGILPSLKVQFGGKIMTIKVEVVDAPLDYNILLGRNWIYNMQVVASSLLWVVCFPLGGRIVTTDQRSFDNSSSKA